MVLNPESIADEIYLTTEDLFNKLDVHRQEQGMKPSALADLLGDESDYWKNAYIEWFEWSGDPFE